LRNEINLEEKWEEDRENGNNGRDEEEVE